MSLLFIDSFDHYGASTLVANQVTAKWSANHIDAGHVKLAQGRCGTSGLECGGNTGLISKGINATGASGVIGFAYRVEATLGDQLNLVVNDYLGWHFTLTWAKGTGGLYITDGAGVTHISVNDVVRQYVYYFIEVKFTLHASAGTVQVRVNGDSTPVLNLSGINTIGAGTAGWGAVSFELGQNSIYHIDDLYVCDGVDGTATQGRAFNDFLGDVHVGRLRPTANGTTQQWDVTGAGGIAWTAVDDDATHDGDTSYISTAVVGEDALFLFNDPAAPVETVLAVQTNLMAVKEMPGVRTVAPLIRVGGTTTAGANVNPSQTDYHDHHQIWGKNPTTNALWTPAQIAAGALQVGGRLTS